MIRKPNKKFMGYKQSQGKLKASISRYRNMQEKIFKGTSIVQEINDSKICQRSLSKIKTFQQIKGNISQSVETSFRMGENLCQQYL